MYVKGKLNIKHLYTVYASNSIYYHRSFLCFFPPPHTHATSDIPAQNNIYLDRFIKIYDVTKQRIGKVQDNF